jgi:hypothetical protein
MIRTPLPLTFGSRSLKDHQRADMPVSEQLKALVDLDSEEYRLTDWEVEFVDSVEKRTRNGREITPKQEQIISDIYDLVFIHGKRGAQ